MIFSWFVLSFCCVTITGHTYKGYSLNFDLTGQNTEENEPKPRKEMMKDKLHLTQAGLDSIRTIASGMNRGRMSEYASLRKSLNCVYLLFIKI